MFSYNQPQMQFDWLWDEAATLFLDVVNLGVPKWSSRTYGLEGASFSIMAALLPLPLLHLGTLGSTMTPLGLHCPEHGRCPDQREGTARPPVHGNS